jgi:hypothetical protein
MVFLPNNTTQFALHLFKHTQLSRGSGPPSAIHIYLGNKKNPLLHNLKIQHPEYSLQLHVILMQFTAQF